MVLHVNMNPDLRSQLCIVLLTDGNVFADWPLTAVSYGRLNLKNKIEPIRAGPNAWLSPSDALESILDIPGH